MSERADGWAAGLVCHEFFSSTSTWRGDRRRSRGYKGGSAGSGAASRPWRPFVRPPVRPSMNRTDRGCTHGPTHAMKQSSRRSQRRRRRRSCHRRRSVMHCHRRAAAGRSHHRRRGHHRRRRRRRRRAKNARGSRDKTARTRFVGQLGGGRSDSSAGAGRPTINGSTVAGPRGRASSVGQASGLTTSSIRPGSAS